MNMPLVRAVIVMTIFSLIPSVGVSQWIESNSGLADSTIYAVFASGSKVFAGTDKGAYISVDNAVTWKALNTGLFIQPDSAIRAGDTVMVVLTTDCLNARSAPSFELYPKNWTGCLGGKNGYFST